MEDKLEQISLNSLALFHRCIKYHYTASVVGDDTDKLRFKVPFAPDTLQIISTDPRIMFRNNRVIFITADLNSLGYAGASQTVIRDGKLINTAMTADSINGRVQRAEDGTVTVTCTEGNAFGQDLTYQVVAAKLSDKTLRQRYEEFVESLTGSGTAQVCKTRVYEAFTAGEWAALTATKPDWTFQEV